MINDAGTDVNELPPGGQNKCGRVGFRPHQTIANEVTRSLGDFGHLAKVDYFR